MNGKTINPRLSGFTLIEFLISTLLLSLFLVFYLQWSNLEVVNLRKSALAAQIELIRQASIDYARDIGTINDSAEVMQWPADATLVAGVTGQGSLGCFGNQNQCALSLLLEGGYLTTALPDIYPGSSWVLIEVQEPDALRQQAWLMIRYEAPVALGYGEELAEIQNGLRYWGHYLQQPCYSDSDDTCDTLEIYLSPDSRYVLAENQTQQVNMNVLDYLEAALSDEIIELVSDGTAYPIPEGIPVYNTDHVIYSERACIHQTDYLGSFSCDNVGLGGFFFNMDELSIYRWNTVVVGGEMSARPASTTVAGISSPADIAENLSAQGAIDPDFAPVPGVSGFADLQAHYLRAEALGGTALSAAGYALANNASLPPWQLDSWNENELIDLTQIYVFSGFNTTFSTSLTLPLNNQQTAAWTDDRFPIWQFWEKRSGLYTRHLEVGTAWSEPLQGGAFNSLPIGTAFPLYRATALGGSRGSVDYDTVTSDGLLGTRNIGGSYRYFDDMLSGTWSKNTAGSAPPQQFMLDQNGTILSGGSYYQIELPPYMVQPEYTVLHDSTNGWSGQIESVARFRPITALNIGYAGFNKAVVGSDGLYASNLQLGDSTSAFNDRSGRNEGLASYFSEFRFNDVRIVASEGSSFSDCAAARAESTGLFDRSRLDQRQECNVQMDFQHLPGADGFAPPLLAYQAFEDVGLLNTLARRSDARLKQGIKPLSMHQAALGGIRAYSYTRKVLSEGLADAPSTPSRELGFLAQEVNAFYPDIVEEAENGYLAVEYEAMVPVLWGQASRVREQEQNHKKRLQAKLDRLEEALLDP